MKQQQSISCEASGYEAGLAAAGVEVTRIGRGQGPNVLRTVRVDGAMLFSGFVGFPVIGRSAVPDDTILLILGVAVPDGTRWCGLDLSPHDVLVYGPGAEHTARSPVGLEYRFALVEQQRLDETADALGVSVRHPARRSVTRLRQTRLVEKLEAVLLGVGNPLGREGDLSVNGTQLLEATVRILAEPSSLLRPRQTSRIDNRLVITRCIDYADAVGRIPTVSELCSAAFVSERRMRLAFTDVFDMPPNAFFRTRLLSRARDRLIAGTSGRSVTEVAEDLGFDHLGRFASQYMRIFKEQPHETAAVHRRADSERSVA